MRTRRIANWPQIDNLPYMARRARRITFRRTRRIENPPQAASLPYTGAACVSGVRV